MRTAQGLYKKSPRLHGDAHTSTTSHAHDTRSTGSSPHEHQLHCQFPSCTGNGDFSSALVLIQFIVIHIILTNKLLPQATKADDDDFQDFQEAPKPGAGDQAFTEFQGESGASFPTTIAPQHQNRYRAVETLSGLKR